MSPADDGQGSAPHVIRNGALQLIQNSALRYSTVPLQDRAFDINNVHLYAQFDSSTINVLDMNNGTLVTTISLPEGVTLGPMGYQQFCLCCMIDNLQNSTNSAKRNTVAREPKKRSTMATRKINTSLIAPCSLASTPNLSSTNSSTPVYPSNTSSPVAPTNSTKPLTSLTTTKQANSSTTIPIFDITLLFLLVFLLL